MVAFDEIGATLAVDNLEVEPAALAGKMAVCLPGPYFPLLHELGVALPNPVRAR